MRIDQAADCDQLLAALGSVNPQPATFKYSWVGLQTFTVYRNAGLPRNTIRVDRFGQVTYYTLDKDGRLVERGPEARL